MVDTLVGVLQTHERFIILLSYLTISEALKLCDYKMQLIKERPLDGKSKNSLVLIYVTEIDFHKIHNYPNILKR